MFRFKGSLFLGISFFCLTSPLFCENPSKTAIVVENRVLATVRDQVITVQDVVKKLDMIFYQSFPQYRTSADARYDFYTMHWKRVLEDLVDRQLVLLWAEERQFPVSNGDIRQELEDVFGPDVMMNMYESGFSLHDVQEMIRADILLRRILYFQVRLPVLSMISPQRLRALYEEKLRNGSRGEILSWRSVSIKEKGGECSKSVADSVRSMLQKQHLSLDEIRKKVSDSVEITLSEQFLSEQKDVAPHVYEVLSKLECGIYSEPISFVGKQNNSKGWRLYTVESREQKKALSFMDMEEELRGELAGPQIEKRTKQFFADLRKQYQVSELSATEENIAFHPFSLRAGDAVLASRKDISEKKST